MHNLTARDALQASIINRLPELSHDELRVFDVQLDRMLRIGRGKYEPLNLAKDHRDWSEEISQELSDALFYLCARHVAREDAKRERRECIATDRNMAALAPLYELPEPRSSYECVDGAVHEVLR